DPSILARADLNNDSRYDATDVQSMVNLLLSANCTFSLNPMVATFRATAGTSYGLQWGYVDVSTGANCHWDLSTDPPFDGYSLWILPWTSSAANQTGPSH